MDRQLFSLYMQQLNGAGFSICKISKLNDNGSVDIEGAGEDVIESADLGANKTMPQYAAKNVFVVQLVSGAGGITIKPGVGDYVLMLHCRQSVESGLFNNAPGPLDAASNGLALLFANPNSARYSVPEGVDTFVYGESVLLGKEIGRDSVALGTPVNSNFDAVVAQLGLIRTALNSLLPTLAQVPPMPPLIGTKATNVEAS